eukprot:scaffold11463_cov124-Isochrysis_galbana.AAC.10
MAEHVAGTSHRGRSGSLTHQIRQRPANSINRENAAGHRVRGPRQRTPRQRRKPKANGNPNKPQNRLTCSQSAGQGVRRAERSRPTVGVRCVGKCALILLGLQLGATVEDLDVQLRRALHDLLALARGDVVGDLRRIPPVLHEEHIQLLDRADSEFVKAARQKVARLLVRTVTHVDQQGQALEPGAIE